LWTKTSRGACDLEKAASQQRLFPYVKGGCEQNLAVGIKSKTLESENDIENQEENTGSDVARDKMFRVLKLGRGLRLISEQQCPHASSVVIEQGHGNAIDENLENPDEDVTNHRGSTESLSLRPQASTQRTATNRASGRTRKDTAGRRKWSKQENMEILFLFYKFNECDDLEKAQWRQKLFEAYTELYPGHTLTEQNLADRKRTTIKKNYVSVDERDQIKRDMGYELSNSERLNSEEELREADGSATDELTDERPKYKYESFQRIQALFNRNIAKYTRTPPIHRLLILRINRSRHIKEWLQILNEIIEKFLSEDQNFQQTHLSVYCAVVTIAEMQQVQLKPRHGGPTNANRTVTNQQTTS
jgi:hypothetical protein